ncbi:YdcF family protein [Vibrio aquaticus]|uniref:YdcF family protein n=1 Tax=Vibrio aquaticus TaxID=2496559 RepID=A0A432CVT4_9VIBR|nr:YdcF family protein [Vibrio aquaticus]RTZ15820.1 YdcF family protein [Vibrio aquaticus]
MQLEQPLITSDCIFVLGSNDVRVAEYAAQLYLDGWANILVFSGGVGRLTEDLFEQSEAETFAAVAKDMGVPASAIVIENQATNTGENVRFTAEVLQQLGLTFSSFILVQKPYMERRTHATFLKQWPTEIAQLCVTSPKTRFCDYFNEEIDLDTTVRAMLGDFERIKTYPALGFQIEQAVPEPVEHAYQAILSRFEQN